ncbi:ABC transporter permease subunit [Ktedonobacter robiniae]|uniref:ABC transporter permease n=1 Tax=Ktedonobacter robiniae TaxID=2778365 RepID=A0ABQ3USA0_9CHLR|nr:ABC transporter permease subunit [Ktedonobacter robiniae]GHO55601.1 hypothetical protein KSB_40760 [Ktedonobacter robiniae]
MSMTTTSAQAQSISSTPSVHSLKPSFFGILRGELLKVSRLLITRVMVVCLIGGTVLLQFFLLTSNSMRELLAREPLSFLYRELDANLMIMRVFGGMFLLVLTSYAIGLDYQYGTIRILLARGVGRVQLLLAKITAMLCVALILFACWSLLSIILSGITILSLTGSFNTFGAINSKFWADAGLYALTVLISMTASIMAATMFTALSRSLALGLGGAIALFPLDNMSVLVFMILAQVTQSEIWLNITAYLLGPNLNAMPVLLLPNAGFTVMGFGPLIKGTGVHSLWVTLAYTVVFTVVSIVVTWKRDVKE